MRTAETADVEPDFYVKTLHDRNYWSKQQPGQDRDVIDNYGIDNYWCQEPDKVIGFMSQVTRPWIAYKVLAAGAIHSNEGFKYAFQNGADFALVRLPGVRERGRGEQGAGRGRDPEPRLASLSAGVGARKHQTPGTTSSAADSVLSQQRSGIRTLPYSLFPVRSSMKTALACVSSVALTRALRVSRVPVQAFLKSYEPSGSPNVCSSRSTVIGCSPRLKTATACTLRGRSAVHITRSPSRSTWREAVAV